MTKPASLLGRNAYAWGLVHVGDRFGEPMCRVKAMSSPSHSVDGSEVPTCLWCVGGKQHDGEA